MGILGEFLIIIAVAFTGMLISLIPGFPLPGAISGMIIMLVLLLSGIIKLVRIQKAADFFLKFLPLFFIPLVVNLMKESEVLTNYGIKLILIIIPTTILTLGTTAITAKLLLGVQKNKDSGR